MSGLPDQLPAAGNRGDAGSEALAEALATSFRLLRLAIGLAVAAYLLSGLFVVRQDEKALVLRLGHVQGLGAERVKGPGLHWTLPKPFCEVLRIPTEQVRTAATRSFWYEAPDDPEAPAPAPGESLRPGLDGCALTADANLLHARWAVRYTIADPEAALFVAADLPLIVRHELDRAVVRRTAGFPVDRALRTEIEALRDAVEGELRRRLDALGLGVRVQGVDVLALAPPRQVAPAFDAVTSAEQKRGRLISEAAAYATRALNEAQGEAARLRAEGEAYRRRIVSELEAQAAYFEEVRAKVAQNPAVVSRTLLQDGVRRALAPVEHKYIVRGGGGARQIRLQLGGEAAAPAGAP